MKGNKRRRARGAGPAHVQRASGPSNLAGRPRHCWCAPAKASAPSHRHVRARAFGRGGGGEEKGWRRVGMVLRGELMDVRAAPAVAVRWR